MKEFKKLLNGTISRSQLFKYLVDAQLELKNEKYNRVKVNYFKCGEFFDRAYGLYLAPDQKYKLGEFIASGLYKPRSMRSSKLAEQSYADNNGSLELYWGNL